MMDKQLAIQIRTKKLGVLILDAREAAGRTKRECAEALGVTTGVFSAYENGTKAPSLPELEALAYFLDIPVSHFWGNTAISEMETEGSIAEKIAKSMEARHQLIRSRLQEAREEAGLSLAELGRRSGISPHRLKKYESGQAPIPAPELEQLAAVFDTTLQAFSNGQGPVADWMREQAVLQQVLEMPEDLQEFVCKPFNRPYLEIAHRLSQMEVEKLRTVAEGLLDITL